MSKFYEVKLYSPAGVFKKQLNPKNITSEISFSEELDGGQGNMVLDFVGDLSDFSESDIVEVREADTENRTIAPTYSGIIEDISVSEYKDNTVLKISLLGAFTALNDVLYKSAGNRAFNKTDTVGNIVKSIVDSFNTDYGALSGTQNLSGNLVRYTGGSIDATGATVSRSFDNENCLSALQKTIENTGFQFFIGPDGILYLKKLADWSTKILTFEREIISIEQKRHKRDMVNKYYLQRNGGTELIYTDAPSVSAYKLKEKTESKTDILDATTQNVVGAQYLLDYANPRTETTVRLKALSYADLTPGMKLTTQNTRTPLVAQQVTKITKKRTQWDVSIGDFSSFGKTVLGG